MSATQVISGLKVVKGIGYEYTTVSSANWSSVPNSKRFYDIATELVYFKDSVGEVHKLYGTPAINKTIAIENPASGDNITFFYNEKQKLEVIEAIAVIQCPTASGGTVTYEVKHGVGRGTVDGQISNGPQTVTSETSGDSMVLDSNPTAFAGAWFWIEISGTVTNVDYLSINLRYIEVD